MPYAIIAFALALAVPTVVGLALLIYVQNTRSTLALAQSASFSAMRDTSTTLHAQLNAKLDALTDRVSRCENGLQQTSNAHLATEQAALAADVEALAKAMRKNFGRVFAELHADGTEARNRSKQHEVESPEEVRARLRAEHGLPKLAGGKPNGE